MLRVCAPCETANRRRSFLGPQTDVDKPFSKRGGFCGSRLIAGSVRPLFISRIRATVFRVVPIVELQRLGGATRLQRSLKFQPIALALDEANLKTARGVERGVERRAQVMHHHRED